MLHLRTRAWFKIFSKLFAPYDLEQPAGLGDRLLAESIHR